MSRQAIWNKYEVALLIDTYLKVTSQKVEKIPALIELSRRLRTMATNAGIAIDDTYRNLNGMMWQYGFMEKAFQNKGNGSHMPPKVFVEMVKLYNTQRDVFNEILTVAYESSEEGSDYRIGDSMKTEKVDFNEREQKRMAYYQFNYEHNGIEIYFEKRPSLDVLEKLRNNGWHWYKAKKCWYAKRTSITVQIAEEICNGTDGEHTVTVYVAPKRNDRDSRTTSSATKKDNVTVDSSSKKDDFVGKKVYHASFGAGIIIEQTPSLVSVKFEDDNNIRRFQYPTCFDQYLNLFDAEIQNEKISMQETKQSSNMVSHEKEASVISSNKENKVFKSEMISAEQTRGTMISVVPYDKTQDYSYTEPLWYRYKEQNVVHVHNWAKLYTLLMRQMAKDYPDIFVAELSLLSSDRLDIVRATEKHKLRRHAELYNGLVIEINISARDFMKRLAVAASKAGIMKDEIEICFIRKNGADEIVRPLKSQYH